MATTTVPEVNAPPPVSFEDAQAAWTAERNTFLGGSEAFELLNEKQYGRGCVRALAYRKLGIEPDYPEERDEALLNRGNLLEPLVAALYERETGRKVRRLTMDDFGLPRTQRSREFPWAGVHTDRLILAGAGDVTETGDLELKTHGEGPFLHYMREGLPAGHRLQVQWSNFVTGHTWGAFAILGVFGGLPLKHFDVTRDEEMVEIFKRAGDSFANTVWGKGQLPERPFPADDQRCKTCPFRMTCRGEEIDADEARRVAAEKAGKKVLAQVDDADLARALYERDLLRAEIGTLEAKLKEYDANLIPALQLTPDAYVKGYGKVYVKPAMWYGVDVARLKADKPDVYQEYFVNGRETGSRYLRVYPNKA